MSSVSTVERAERTKPASVKMSCMEIWGGNGEHDSAISVPGIDAWICSHPMPGHRKGGDIHYVSRCGMGHVVRFVVADVSGHGEEAAHFAAVLRSLMRRYITTLNQAKFARALNREFTRRSSDGTFATAILATYYTVSKHLVLVNAGHPAPLWYRADKREWRVVCPEMPECEHKLANLPLGVISPTDYQQFAIPLAKDDIVLIYTDSFIEAKSPQGRQLGEAGLLEIVGRLDTSNPLVFRESLMRAVAEYRGNKPPEDDMTLLLLQHNAADPPWPGMGETLRSIGKMMRLLKV